MKPGVLVAAYYAALRDGCPRCGARLLPHDAGEKWSQWFECEGCWSGWYLFRGRKSGLVLTRGRASADHLVAEAA